MGRKNVKLSVTKTEPKKIPSRGFKYGPGKFNGVDPNRPKTRSRLNRWARERAEFSQRNTRKAFDTLLRARIQTRRLSMSRCERNKDGRITRRKGCFPWWYFVSFSWEDFQYKHNCSFGTLRENSFHTFLCGVFLFSSLYRFQTKDDSLPLSTWTLQQVDKEEVEAVV